MRGHKPHASVGCDVALSDAGVLTQSRWDDCRAIVEPLDTTPPSEPMQAADLGRRPPDGHAASELSSAPEFNPSAAKKQSAKTAGK